MYHQRARRIRCSSRQEPLHFKCCRWCLTMTGKPCVRLGFCGFFESFQFIPSITFRTERKKGITPAHQLATHKISKPLQIFLVILNQNQPTAPPFSTQPSPPCEPSNNTRCARSAAAVLWEAKSTARSLRRPPGPRRACLEEFVFPWVFSNQTYSKKTHLL